MNENTQSSSLILKITSLAAVLIILTLWAGHRTQLMMNHTLERTVERQAADLSVMAEERFGQEFETLTLAAGLLSSALGTPEEARILSELRSLEHGTSVGILSVEGNALAGEYLSRWHFLRLPHSFRGQNIVDYCQGKGLLFAVPIRNGHNIRAVLYRLYNDDVLTEHFSLTNYHPSIRLLLQNKSGLLIVPYRHYDENAKAFFADAEIREAFSSLRQQLRIRRSAATYVKHNGKSYFLFASDLPETDCTVVGYIPWATMVGDIALIYERTLRSIGMLLLIFLTTGLYLAHIRRKAMESDALRREKEIADSANQAKGAFLASMSHEIRTPINAVLGMNEMILREGNDPAIAGYARNIQSAGRTLLDLINDVLDFSKIESGKIEITEGDYHLSDLLRNAVNMAKPRAEGKGLSFGIDVDGTLPDALFGDMTRVQQIVVNLLTNAAKYTEKGSVNFRVSGERDEASDDVVLHFVVQDTGIGIRDEDKEKLFKDFERFDSARNRGIEGTGLGLAITKRLANLMGGDIVFESTYGVGSVFTATIPQKIDGDEPIGDFAARLSEISDKEAYRAAFTAPDAKLLVVDDNEMNLMVVEGILKETAVKIDAVTSGQAALDLLAKNRYDMVLLDHRMPGMSGVETLHAAKELPNAEGTPFLILTADAVAGMREQFLAEGFNDYLTKPIDSATLEWTIMRYLPVEKVHPATDAPPEQKRTEPTVTEEKQEDELPVLDKAVGLRFCGNSEMFFREIAAKFLDLFPRKKADLENTYETGNWKDYVTYAHALKSSSLAIGGRRISEAAKEIEAYGKRYLADDADAAEKEESLAAIREKHGRMLELYEELTERLKEELGKQ